MQQELIKMLEKVTEYIVICNNYDQRFSSTSYGVSLLKEAEALVEKAKNNAKEPAVPDVDSLAQFIRQIDGSHTMGTAALAERICEWLNDRKATEQAAPVVPQGVIYEKADSLYKRGYTDLQCGKDYDPRGCDEWQEVVDCLAATTVAQSQPSKYGSPELQALIVAHATQSQPVRLTDERLREIDDAHNWQTTEGRMAAYRAIIAALRQKDNE